MKTSEQCIRDRANHFASVDSDEACLVTGTMNVNKVSGNFHMSFGESIVRDGRHIHQFNPETAHTFNVSHTIHSLSFGDPYPNMPRNPLDKTQRIVGTGASTGLYQYFIRVIPTIYTDESTQKTNTNQFTVTDRFRPLSLPKIDSNGNIQMVTDAVLPGIFFVYELSPFMIEASSSRMPFFHLLTKICAIVGGVFTVIGVLDSIIFKLQKLLGFKSK